MAIFKYKTRADSSPQRKPRVYFTCHPKDFSNCFEKICEDIFKTQDCAIYYTEDMNEEIEEKYKESDLGQMNLFVIPVTFSLLSESNRAMSSDLKYAQENHIPILPIMIEPGLTSLYSQKDKFYELQYLDPFSNDLTAISYEEKLKKFLNSVLISDEMAKKIRNAFDAYIFMSYRKKDRHYANELMKMIHKHPEFHTIAIWYDEFLTPGESFRENIEKMMRSSKLVTLLVTPNLLEYVDGKPNYVMEHEYPDARKAEIEILPIEMETTDKNELHSKYDNIPECVRPNDTEAFKKRLFDTLSRTAHSESKDDPEHNFLIGLAYLEGIDVEVDHAKGFTLVSNTANSGFIPAMKKMRELYMIGDAVKADYYKGISWQSKIVLLLKSHLSMGDCDVASYIKEVYQLGDDYKKVGMQKDAFNAYNTATSTGLDNLKDLLSSPENIDLIVQGCIKTGDAAYAIKDLDEALQKYNCAENIINTLKKDIGSADSSLDIQLKLLSVKIASAFSKVYQGEANFNKAESYINKALALCQSLIELKPLSPHMMISIGFVYITSAEIAFDRQDYTKSEKDYKAAISVFDSIYKDSGAEEIKKTIASLYHRLSLVAHFLTDFDLKKYYEEKGEKLHKQIKLTYNHTSIELKKSQAKEFYEQRKYHPAYELCSELVELGEVSSLKNLAFLYRLGNGVEKSIPTAIALYEKAIAAGDGIAATTLGMMYRDGNDVEKNEQTALELFQKAMELGDSSGRLLYQALKSKLEYEESKKVTKSYTKTSEEFPCFDNCKKVAEINLGKETVSLILTKELTSACLVRSDGRMIDRFSVWAPGWGDFTSFDLWVENNRLAIKEASFCHYDRYTEITVYKYKEIMSESIEVEVFNEEDRPGRVCLPIGATGLLNTF